MRGEVLSFDPATGSGLIAGEDGGRYSFTTADLAAPIPAHPGSRLDFVPVGTGATQIMAAPGQAAAAPVAATRSSMFSPVTPDPVGEPDLGVWGYIKRCLTKKYADFNGRARRKEYWSFYLLVLVLILPLYTVQLFLAVAASVGADAANTSATADQAGVLGMAIFSLVIGLVVMVIAFGVMVPQYAVLVRRLHDIGLSGWWILVAFVPLVGLCLIVVPFMPSQPGANIYGGYPKPVI